MNELPAGETRYNFCVRVRPLHRFSIALVVSFITWLLTRKMIVNPLVMIMVLWEVFCIAILFNAWLLFFTCPPAIIRRIASKEDGSRLFVLVVVLISSLASMITVVFLIFSGPSPHRALYVAIAIVGMLLSWTMVHTTFCFHYAYMYYGDDEDTPDTHAGGLSFPEEAAPDYLDFAYFSFVIGMTFQVSDVVITSRAIRRQVLVHGLLAFALNTFVVALTVNLVAGLKP